MLLWLSWYNPPLLAIALQTLGQVLITVLESSKSTFINPQVQVHVLGTYVKYRYFIPSTIYMFYDNSVIISPEHFRVTFILKSTW